MDPRSLVSPIQSAEEQRSGRLCEAPSCPQTLPPTASGPGRLGRTTAPQQYIRHGTPKAPWGRMEKGISNLEEKCGRVSVLINRVDLGRQ